MFRTIEKIATDHVGQRVAIACHGGVINTYVAMLWGADVDTVCHVHHTSITTVRAMDETGTQVVLASTFEADAVAEVLAGQSEQTLEVQALHIDDLGEPTSEEGTYVGLLEELARQVRAELI